MSGPYDQYSQPQGPGGAYGSGYGYPPQQNQDYSAPPYAQQPSGYASYGPPAQGGFEHQQQPPAHPYDGSGGQYQPNYQPNDPSSYPQHQQAPYGQEEQRGWGNPEPSQQFPQSGAYGQNPAPYDNSNPYSAPGMQGQAGPEGAAEGERGLMGALAGGAAGMYGGHKAGHGFIGTIAGAFMGSKLEDEYKDHHRKDKLQNQYGQQYGYQQQGGHHKKRDLGDEGGEGGW